jgi:glyoxylate/hydroxypyruvate reductase
MTLPTLLINTEPARWLPALRAAAPEMQFRPQAEIGDAADVDAILTWKVDPALIDALPNLRLLYAVGAGVDYLVDLARTRPQLQIARVVDDAVTGDVATLAVAGTLQWFRDLPAYAGQKQNELWHPLPVRSTADTTIGILGLGRIGRAIARAFQALGFRVCGWSRSIHRMEGVSTYTGSEGLHAMLPQAQVLVCALPLTAETEGIISAQVLGCLPPKSFFVNVGRGLHVDEVALQAALDSGRLAGAFLDVFAEEPLAPGHSFWLDARVQITPHVASRTRPSRVAPQIIDNLLRLRTGQPLLNLVRPEAGY